jgi:hypothetical protein
MNHKYTRVILESIIIFGVVCLVWGNYYHGFYADQMKNKKTANEKTVPVAHAQAVSQEAIEAKPEDRIYSYYQGPKAWKAKLSWSGYWGKKLIDGQFFGAYGCGACCMANIYSTFSPYRCTPVDVYEHTKKVTEYGGGGAIEWKYLTETLQDIGFPNELATKPSTYEEFRQDIASLPCAIVLVTSYEKGSFWENTPGHYVTIFDYDEKMDKVFLADSGNIEHNRRWVSLKSIYKSLKTVSKYQYIKVSNYQEELNQWKHKEAGGKWIK